MSFFFINELDSITAGTAVASKALVLDSDKNIATIGTIGCGAITSTGTSSFGAIVPASANGGALGSADNYWSDLYLASGGVVYFGNSQEITLTHVDNSGLILKHATAGDDKFPTFTLQTGDTDIGVNDKLGVINFQAPDEVSLNDARSVAAGIEAVSEGDFAGGNNATKLVFKTASSGTASDTMSLSSEGNLTLGGTTLTFGNGATIVNSSSSLLTITEAEVLLPTTTKLSFFDEAGGENIFASADGHLEVNAGTTLDITAPTVDINTDTVTFASSNENDPLVIIKNTNNDTNGARLRFVKDKGVAGADGDVSGLIEFYADDDDENQTLFAKIEGKVVASADGSERGQLSFYAAQNNGTNTSGLQIAGTTTSGRVDVTLAAAATSITTISGNLNITTVAAAESVDKFLVYDSGDIKYRTGTQVASDIGAVSSSGDNTFTGNQTFSGKLFLSVQDGSTTITSDSTDTLTISQTSVLLAHVGSASTQTYTIGDGTDGQIVHFFFSTEASNQIIKLDFGAGYLASGSGPAQSLTFNTTGQSATLVFTSARTINSVSISKMWRIINTGAVVA